MRFFLDTSFPFRRQIRSLLMRTAKTSGIKLIFVLGNARSGTTFLFDCLKIGRDDILHLNEPVNKIFYTKAKGSFLDKVNFIMSEKERRLHYLVGYLLVCMLYGVFSRKKAIFIKELYLHDVVEDISGAFESKIIFISRHPCAVFESLKRKKALHSNRLIEIFPEEFGSYWGKSQFTAKKQFQGHPEWVWVSFEALCANPMKEFKKIYAQTGLEWSNDIEKEIIKKTATASDEYYETNRIAKEQIDKWKNRLSLDEIDAVRRGCLPYKTNLYEGF